MAFWPSAVATDANLYVAVNSLQTTLSTGLGTGDVSVVLASATGFPVAGAVTIDNEVIFYTNISGSTLTGCTRGADGTTAATHSVGVPVGASIVAFHHNGLKNEIEAVESYLNTVLGKSTSVVAAEFAYLAGVTSAIQTQLNAKATDSLVVHLAGSEVLTGGKTLNALTLGGNAAGGGFKFTGLGAGSTSGDSVRYEQVLLLAGGTMAGNIAMGSNKLTGLAAGSTNGDSLRYEQLIGQYLLLTGGTMSGAIAMGSNKITGLTAGSATGEAAVFEQTAQTGDIKPSAALAIASGWLECDGTAVSRTTYSVLFAAIVKSATITVTIASPGVVTWTAHGLRNNMPVKFTTSGALPTGIVSGTTYYIINKATDTFQIAATPGGTAINTSGSQSGTHTGTCAPYGTGDGSTTFNLPNLIGKVPIGAGTYTDSVSGSITRGLGDSGGAEKHVLITAELPAHNHNVYCDNDVAGASGGGPRVRRQGSSNTNYTDMTANTGSGTAHNNMQPYLVATWIIKT